MHTIKIAYIGGGSKQWARVFMNDLALATGLCGEIALFDIDREAATRNQRIGARLNRSEKTLSRFIYSVAPDLDTALCGATFVVLSILPGTFDDMASDVHAPEKYGIWQSVGDTAGPGGVLRAMRTVPLYEGFARAIARHCPDAWVINFTNPMTVCTKTLYDVFPAIKAFGCCHEVFHAQEFLACVAAEAFGIPRPARRDIVIDVSGVNHFTWIPKATWNGRDLMAELPAFIDRHFDRGYCEKGDPDGWDDGYFNCGNKVKMDLFRRFGALGAAGDRHLAEFMEGSTYLTDPARVASWRFTLTPVTWRILARDWLVRQSIELASDMAPLDPEKSDEEAVDLMRALLGDGDVTSNVNMQNRGQMADYPLGAVVETNCKFSRNRLEPIRATALPAGAAALVARASANAEMLYAGIHHRDLTMVFASFIRQPSLDRLAPVDALALFCDMIRATADQLNPYYDVSEPALAAIENGKESPWTK